MDTLASVLLSTVENVSRLSGTTMTTEQIRQIAISADPTARMNWLDTKLYTITFRDGSVFKGEH